MNILIVDDEAQIRRWFETLLQRTGLDINVAGACGNGKEALEFCREHPVDLVITDIKMPVMDGLQLIRQLVERQPGVRSLILSSYDEFKYASEALKLGASEYILKAEVTVDGLREVIGKLQAQMAVERRREDEVHSLKSRLNENRYALRAIYFKELLKGQPAAVREFRDKMIWLDVPLSDKHPMLMTVSLDDYPSCLSEAKIRTPELLESAILNILDETVRGETGGGCSFLYEENLFVVACNADGFGGKSIRDKSLRCAHRLSNNLREFLRVPASVGISEPYPDLSALGRQLGEGMEALRRQRFYGKRNIVWFPDTKLTGFGEPSQTAYAIVSDIAYYVETGSYDEALRALHACMDNDLRAGELSESGFKAFGLELLYTVLQKVRKLDPQSETLARYQSFSPAEELNRLRTFEEVKAWLAGQVAELLREAKRLRPPYSEPIRQAFRYLAASYAEDISLQQVADHVHLNKTYLSELFKKETGISFNDYLTDIRIGKAKELIRAGEARMGALAELVGYPNASYFTKVFKKATGMTPLEYKMSANK